MAARLAMADELLVLALCGSHEDWAVRSHGSLRIPPGTDRIVAGAELAELSVLGRIYCAGGPVAAIASAPIGDRRGGHARAVGASRQPPVSPR